MRTVLQDETTDRRPYGHPQLNGLSFVVMEYPVRGNIWMEGSNPTQRSN